ncbi:unnamed protein product [Rhizophagus irregularis]|nr:unnamed protein product [Rhizophagus irregularis]
MPVETTHRTLDNKVLPDETSFVIIKKLRFVSGKRRERDSFPVSREGFRITEKPKDSRSVSRVGFRRTEESRFVTSSGGLPKNENPKIRTFVSSGGLPKNENPKIRFGWASEERKPKDSYFRSGGLPKNETQRFVLSFGWASKKRNPKIRKFGWASEERRFTIGLGFRVPKNGKFQDSIGWGFRPSGKEEPRFVRSGGLPTFGKRGTKIRFGWASDLREKRNQDSFGWIAKE